MAAVTAVADPVPGCTVTRLGGMRYRPMAASAGVRRWFPDGPTPEALEHAPVVLFDRKDDLQHRYLRGRLPGPVQPPTHYVPSTADFLAAVRAGMGWGMLPELQAPVGDPGLVALGGDPVDIPLYWQQWSLRTRSLDAVAAAVIIAVRRAYPLIAPRASARSA